MESKHWEKVDSEKRYQDYHWHKTSRAEIACTVKPAMVILKQAPTHHLKLKCSHLI
jgi:hypothetical protein